MPANPSKYRYVHYIANRILLAEELATQQRLDRLVGSDYQPLAYEMNALYRPGATMNVKVQVQSGTVVSLTPIDNAKPMLIFCRGIWEPFTSDPIDLVAATKIYLNYVVISQPQSTGDAEMAELQLSLSTTDQSGAANSSNSEIERNASPIVAFNFTNVNSIATYQPVDNVVAGALANNQQGGLVKLTTGTSSGVALASDDVAVTNQRVPTDGSVKTSKVAALVTSGTNSDGSAKVDPNAGNQGGIDSKRLIYSPGTKSVEDAITAVGASVAGVVTSLSGHIGKPLGAGVHPMPSAYDVGAAPASHVGSSFDGQHVPSFTSDNGGFSVNRNQNVGPSGYGFLIRQYDGGIVIAMQHDGNLVTPKLSYPYISLAYDDLRNHINAHGNPHGLTLGDIGACSLAQEQNDVNAINGHLDTHDSQIASILNSFGNSLLGNGYTRIPGGLILQWGVGQSMTSSVTITQTVNFPIQFPNACLMASIGDRFDGGGDNDIMSWQATGWNQFGVNCRRARRGDDGNFTSAPTVIAIGF